MNKVNLKNYNTYKINTSADYLYEVTSIINLQELIEKLNKSSIKYFILGSGSNVILPDNHFKGAIIKLKFNNFILKDDTSYVSADINLNEFIKKTLDHGYTNLVNLYGIPGTIGGALYGNAGAYKSFIFDFVESILIYNSGNIKLVNARNIKHGYRFANFQESDIILGATINLVKGDTKDAWNKIKENMLIRKNTQPLDYPSAGSVFKNPPGLSAGKLIDECGLKGFTIGGATISKKHANFIINTNNAKSKDIIKLIEIVKEKVKREKNIELEMEQKIIRW